MSPNLLHRPPTMRPLIPTAPDEGSSAGNDTLSGFLEEASGPTYHVYRLGTQDLLELRWCTHSTSCSTRAWLSPRLKGTSAASMPRLCSTRETGNSRRTGKVICLHL